MEGVEQTVQQVQPDILVRICFIYAGPSLLTPGFLVLRIHVDF